MEVLEYQAADGSTPYVEWIRRLKDRQGVAVIRNRINRIRENNHFGDHRNIGDGIWELRIFFGPGYRVYYLRDGDSLVLLLCGGDKDSQSRDIHEAKLFAAHYWRQK